MCRTPRTRRGVSAAKSPPTWAGHPPKQPTRHTGGCRDVTATEEGGADEDQITVGRQRRSHAHSIKENKRTKTFVTNTNILEQEAQTGEKPTTTRKMPRASDPKNPRCRTPRRPSGRQSAKRRTKTGGDILRPRATTKWPQKASTRAHGVQVAFGPNACQPHITQTHRKHGRQNNPRYYRRQMRRHGNQGDMSRALTRRVRGAGFRDAVQTASRRARRGGFRHSQGRSSQRSQLRAHRRPPHSRGPRPLAFDGWQPDRFHPRCSVVIQNRLERCLGATFQILL